MNKIKTLGLVNLGHYKHQQINPRGNNVTILAKNGTGKTVLMTALYPSLFTMDLRRSLNPDGGFKRKLYDPNNKSRSLMNDAVTYVYGMFTINDSDITLVNAYWIQNSRVESRGYAFDGHDVSFTIGNTTPRTIENFEDVNKEHILYYTINGKTKNAIFNKPRDWRRFIARDIYETSVENLEEFFKIDRKLTSPTITIVGSEGYRLSDLQMEIKDHMVGLSHDNEYVETLSKALFKLRKINKYKQDRKEHAEQLVFLHDRLMEENSRRKKEKDEIEHVIKKLGRDRLRSERAQQDAESIIEDRTSELDQKQKRLSDLRLELVDIESHLRDDKLRLVRAEEDEHRLTREIEMLESEQSRLVDELRRLNSEIDEFSELIADNETSINEFLSQLESIPTDAPFTLSDWSAIEQGFKEVEAHEQDIVRKTALRESLTAKLSEYEEVISNIETDGVSLSQTVDDITALQLEIKELESNSERLLVELEHEQTNRKPNTSFDADDAQPLFELVDFRDGISDDKKRLVENLLREAGLLELLVTAENVRKGSILCD